VNILIYRPMASGKTLLANALVDYYKKNKQSVELIVDGDIYYTASIKKGEEFKEFGKAKLHTTKGKKTKHSIITTQSYPEQIYGFYDNYDYHIKTGGRY